MPQQCYDCKQVKGSVVKIVDTYLCQDCNEIRQIISDNDNEGKNVIINELLCFVVNKIDLLRTDVIVQLCSERFDEKEIHDAKHMLHRIIESESRLIQRRSGPEKKAKDMDDILGLVHACEPEKLPCFVAKNLNKLPPIAMKHVDFSAIISENMQIKYENEKLQSLCKETAENCNKLVSSMRDTFESTMQKFQSELPGMVKGIIDDNVMNSPVSKESTSQTSPKETVTSVLSPHEDNVNTTDSAASAAPQNSGNIPRDNKTVSSTAPLGDGSVRPKDKPKPSDNISSDLDDLINISDDDMHLGFPMRGHSQRSNVNESRTYADKASLPEFPSLPPVNKPHEGPTPYKQQIMPPGQRRPNATVPPPGIPPLMPSGPRPRGRGQRGATIGTGHYSGIKAADGANIAQVFVSRLHPSTEMKTIVRHLNALGITVSDAEEIIPSNLKKGFVTQKTHCSFRFDVPAHMFWSVKKSSMWPSGVLVKRYTPAKNGPPSD